MKDWIEILSKVFLSFGVVVAGISYRSQVQTRRGEWLKSLFEKFYEQSQFKEVRKWIESGEIEKKINLENSVSKQEEQVTDYLNFFEFVAMLYEGGQLRKKDLFNLFEYYLRKLKTSHASMSWINNHEYGFEKLRNLLNKV